MGITSPDPLRLNLYFERFLNPARTTPPDIDSDLCSRRRDSVIQHVFDTYGRDRVAMVGTINRYRPRSALGDVAKAHGLEPAQARELANQLPHSWWARFEETEEGKDPPSPFAELRIAYPAQACQAIFEDAEAILKLTRHLSMHPGGVIVAPGILTDLVPVMRSGGKGVVITQLDLDSVEALGLVKIDLLGIRGLTVLGGDAREVRRIGDGADEVEVGFAGELARQHVTEHALVVDDQHTETFRSVRVARRSEGLQWGEGAATPETDARKTQKARAELRAPCVPSSCRPMRPARPGGSVVLSVATCIGGRAATA